MKAPSGMVLAFGARGHLAGATCDDHPDVTDTFVHVHGRLGHTVERLGADAVMPRLARSVDELDDRLPPPDEMPERAQQAAPEAPLPWEDEPDTPTPAPVGQLVRTLASLIDEARTTAKPQATRLSKGLELLVHHDQGGLYVGLHRPDTPVGALEIDTVQRDLGWADAQREERPAKAGGPPWIILRRPPPPPPEVKTAKELEEARKRAERQAKIERILASKPHLGFGPDSLAVRAAAVRDMKDAELDEEIALLERWPFLECPQRCWETGRHHGRSP